MKKEDLFPLREGDLAELRGHTCVSEHRCVLSEQVKTMSIETLTETTFRERVEQFQGVVLVDFWAPWCGPCRAVGPLIEQLEQHFAGQVRIGKLHVDEQSAIAARYRITSIPTVAIFRNGERVHTLIGVQPLYVYQQALEAALHPSGSVAPNERHSATGNTHRVTVFSTPTCPWCSRLKAYLRKQQIAFKEIDVSRDAHAAQEMVRRSGQMGVPQAWIDGHVVVGFDRRRIDALLGLSAA